MEVLVIAALLAGLAATIKKAVDVVRQVRGRYTNGWATQLVTWASGVALSFLTTAQDALNAVVVSGQPITDWSGLEKAMVGVFLASIASVVNDGQAARDNTSTSVNPPLVPPRPGV